MTDRAVRDAIEDGARTAGQILRACGAGRACGGCTPVLRELIHDGRGTPGRDVDDVIDMDGYREAR